LPSTPHKAPAHVSFVVVANRLPIDRVSGPDGDTWRTSPGGLVTAMEPVLRGRNRADGQVDSAWVGWHGAPDERIDAFTDGGFQIVPVELSAQEVAEYYEGFSNAMIWPLYHDAIATPDFHREWWATYQEVNQRFADRAAEVAAPGAIVWVQDYQLQLVPAMLRKARPDLHIGFFLHIPFPPAELFSQIPRRREIIEGLLGADLIGFQVPGGASNFLRLAKRLTGCRTHGDEIELPDGRRSLARAYPISIDAHEFADLAASPPVTARAAQIRSDLDNPKVLLLGVDRLDYTKGLRQRIRAVGELFAEGRLQPEDAAFVQVATPSRERVAEYQLLRDDIERLVGNINGTATGFGRPLITYRRNQVPRDEIVALYRAADIMLVTPLRDGMNLVAKEYLASRVDDSGALVLSEFAGAARELRQAYQVNPYDINGMKDTIMRAVTDPPAVRRRRLRAQRREVFSHDIAWWADRFLSDLAGVARERHRHG